MRLRVVLFWVLGSFEGLKFLFASSNLAQRQPFLTLKLKEKQLTDSLDIKTSFNLHSELPYPIYDHATFCSATSTQNLLDTPNTQSSIYLLGGTLTGSSKPAHLNLLQLKINTSRNSYTSSDSESATWQIYYYVLPKNLFMSRASTFLNKYIRFSDKLVELRVTSG